MKKRRKDEHFIKKPIYPGGLKAMRQLIKNNLKYPVKALENKIEGTVYLRYGIDYHGKVSEVKTLQSLGHGCDEEAARIVSMFEFRVPKIPRKKKVAFHKTIRINFKLPTEQPKQNSKKSVHPPAQTAYTYTITPKQKEETKTSKKSSYNYTINIG